MRHQTSVPSPLPNWSFVRTSALCIVKNNYRNGNHLSFLTRQMEIHKMITDMLSPHLLISGTKRLRKAVLLSWLFFSAWNQECRSGLMQYFCNPFFPKTNFWEDYTVSKVRSQKALPNFKIFWSSPRLRQYAFFHLFSDSMSRSRSHCKTVLFWTVFFTSPTFFFKNFSNSSKKQCTLSENNGE